MHPTFDLLITERLKAMFRLACRLGLSLFASVLLCTGAYAAAKTYSDNADGTVTDPTTGLTWMRCALGQNWDGNTCTGNVSLFDFQSASASSNTALTRLGFNDWRLPGVRELQSIVDQTASSPAIDPAVFPNTPRVDFWARTPVAGEPSLAWYVSLYSGSSSYYFVQMDTLGVHLVRGGPGDGLSSDDRPTSDYLDNNNDGTVTHIPTGLVWQRCEIGKTWTESSCQGLAGGFTWDEARALDGSSYAGKNDWRLPSKDELASLLDYKKARPALNTTVFPNKSRMEYWSATASLTDEYLAWAAKFDQEAIYNYVRSDTAGLHLYVRSDTLGVHLVRGGNTFPPVVLTVNNSGNGTVASSALAGIACGSACTGRYTTGTKVVLSATPDQGYQFGGWSGACTGTAGCTVTMSADQVVNATFNGIPVISGLPADLGFEPQDIGGTSASKTVTLTNTGTATLNIAGMTSGSEYPLTTSCGTMLAQGASCTITVSFSPTAAGNRSGTITITSNATGSPHSVSLSGTGVAVPLVSFNRNALAFGSQNLASTSNAQTITLTNTGTATLSISGIAATGDFTATNDCAATLAPGANCAISVSFAPIGAGSRSGTITITSNATGSPHGVSLSGTGVPAPVCSVSVTSTWVKSGAPATLTASCVPAATSYIWTGGNCGATASASCSVEPTVTTSYTVAGVNADGIGTPVGATISVAVLGSPVCTLSASPVVVAAGSRTTLTANCSPAATSYEWINTGFGPGVNGGEVSPTKSVMYTVVGSNAVGSGNPASAAVYVCNTPPSENYQALTLTGTGSNEQISSGIEADTIDGGPGFDQVIYNCNRDSFTLTRTASGWMVSSAAEGIDTLANVERIQFGNQILALDISGNAGQAYRIYRAALNRVPDNGGLKDWIRGLDQGMTLEQVAQGFIDSPEFVNMYRNSTTPAEFITKLYNNVLQREPEPEGLAYWLYQMELGRSKASVLVGFSESPENQARVLSAIINGIDLLN